jgi:hypothetical protein
MKGQPEISPRRHFPYNGKLVGRRLAHVEIAWAQLMRRRGSQCKCLNGKDQNKDKPHH